MSPEQKKLLTFAPPHNGTTIVNDGVLFRTEGTRRVISVHGIVFAHYDVTDRAAYGLRTTLVAYVLLALLRIPLPETLKEYAPDDLGHIMGWIESQRS